MGLSIVEKIISEHGGSFRIYNNDNGIGACSEFTRFYMRNNKNILIIDDEKDIESISGILGDEGYVSFVAKNSREALVQIEKNVFDTIILDVWLNDSDLDGIQLLKKIKKR